MHEEDDHSWFKGDLPTWQEVEAKIKELNETDPGWEEKLQAKISEHNAKIVDLGRRNRQ